MDFNNKLQPIKPVGYKAPNGEVLSGEDARKQALADFHGYGKELDEGKWEKNSPGFERSLANLNNARDYIQSLDNPNPKAPSTPLADAYRKNQEAQAKEKEKQQLSSQAAPFVAKEGIDYNGIKGEDAVKAALKDLNAYKGKDTPGQAQYFDPKRAKSNQARLWLGRNYPELLGIKR